MYRLFLFIFIVSSCSSLKLEKLKPKSVKRTEKSKMPSFFVLDYKPKLVKRSPSSVEDEDENFSNKQIYFLTLLQQYKMINNIIGKKSEDFSCPKFHNDLLKFQSMISVNTDQYSLNQNFEFAISNDYALASYPILALPYVDDIDVYSYYKQTESELIDLLPQAIESFNNKNLDEIKELCNVGSSDNYYVFENFVNVHSKLHDFNSSPNVLNTVLKISVFANMLVLDSLINHNDDDINIFNQNVLKRSNLGWFKNYLYELRRIRNNESKLSTNRSLLNEKFSNNNSSSIN